MQSRNRCRITDDRRNTFNVFFCYMFKLVCMCKKYFFAFFECLGIFCILHALDKGIDLFRFDAGQIVSDTDVELESIHASQSIFLCHKGQQKPCFDIFILRLRYIQLSRPLTVVALIIRFDTWFVDARCQLCTVHNLNGLQLEETCSCIVRSNDILCQLAVRTCCRSDRGLQFSSKNSLYLLRICHVWSMYSKCRTFGIMLFDCPF